MYMNDLLPELILLILKYFHLSELKDLRLVCSKWYNCISHLLIKELIVFNNYDSELVNSWSFTYRPLDPKYCLHFNLKRRFFECPIFIFKRLRYLKINSVISKSNFEFKDLNQFDELEQLDIRMCSLKTDDEHLCLPNLKMFSLNSYEYCSLIVDCPKLEKFKYNRFLTLIHFKDRSSIKHLAIVDYDNEIALFQNLEVLWLTKSFQLNSHKDILKQLTHLKEIHLAPEMSRFASESFSSNYEQNQKLVDYLNTQKINLNRPDVRVYLFGVEFTGQHQFENYNFKQDQLRLQSMYYEELANTLPWIRAVNYNHIMNLYDNKIPPDFSKKYINIQRVDSRGKVQNQNSFIEFIMLCKLSHLELIYSDLNSTFYHQLSFICPSLTQLVLKETTDLRLNPEFIFELKLLRSLITNQIYSMSPMLNGFNKLCFLKKIQFFNRKNNSFMDSGTSDAINVSDSDLIYISKNEADSFNLYFREQKIDKALKVSQSHLKIDEIKEICYNLENRALSFWNRK